jgi:SAM-dependent methyltransferase
MLKQAERKAPEIAWVQADGSALPFQDQSFDFVSCQFVFHHMPEKSRCLRDVLRLLKPGGRFVLRNVTSGNVAVWERIRERGEQLDVTGFSDSVDPIDDVAGVAQHPPRTIIMLTDPLDQRVSASSQRLYASALKDAFETANVRDPLDHREITADDDEHHRLWMAALLAVAALPLPSASN